MITILNKIDEHKMRVKLNSVHFIEYKAIAFEGFLLVYFNLYYKSTIIIYNHKILCK